MALSVKNMLGGSGGASPFAWGKYESLTIPPVDAVNPTFNFSSSGNTITIRNSSTDLTLIGDNWKDYFDGFVPNSDTYPYFRKDGTILYVYLNSYTALNIQTIAVTNATSCKLTFNDTYSQFSTAMKYEGTKHIKDGEDTIGNFLEYVTDKNPTKYPNGEVHTDGFFYRYANEGLFAWEKNTISYEKQVVSKSVGTLKAAFYHGDSVVYQGELYAFHGNGTYWSKYNGNSWASMGSTLPYTFDYGCAVVYHDEIHIFGGSNSKSHYKWNGTSWVQLDDMPSVLSHGCAVVWNDRIYALGVNDDAKCYYYNGASWTLDVNVLPYVPNYAKAVVYNNEIHLMGGSTTTTYTYHYKYDGTSWTSVGSLPKNYSGGSAVIYDGCIHILGSKISGAYYMHYKWDGSSWTQVSTLPYVFYYGSAVAYNDNLYIMGAANVSPYTQFYAIIETVEIYTPFDYIISDNENAYPDKAVQDGYYYERSTSGIPLDYFGCTEFELYEFTRTSDTQLSNIKIPCTFGFPKFVSVYAENVPTSPKTYSIYYLTSWNKDGTSNVNAFIGYVNYGSTSYNGNLSTYYYTDGVIFSDSSYFFQGGVNYKVVFGK